MNLSIQKINEESILLDMSPFCDYFTMELIGDYSGLSKLEKREGVRFTVKLQKPTPGFFFSLADFSDENENGVIIFNEEKNLIGAYFFNNNKNCTESDKAKDSIAASFEVK